MLPLDDLVSPRHPIGVVARRTGLKPDLIRAWERRYGAIEPSRSQTRRRFYTDLDIERLLLLRRAIGTGRSIGQVAELSNQTLEELIAQETAAQDPPPLPARASDPSQDESAAGYLEGALAATQRLDGLALELILDQASISLSRRYLLEKLLAPLLHQVGDLWHQGVLRPMHEHLTSAIVRSFLGGMLSTTAQAEPSAARLLVTTPARQHHELGAFLAAATAADEGWQVTYLGPNLPPEEIAAGARQFGARAVALSITYPPDDPLLADDLRRLRRLAGPHLEILVGGRSASAYQATLEAIEARPIFDLESLRQELARVRTLMIERSPGQD